MKSNKTSIADCGINSRFPAVVRSVNGGGEGLSSRRSSSFRKIYLVLFYAHEFLPVCMFVCHMSTWCQGAQKRE